MSEIDALFGNAGGAPYSGSNLGPLAKGAEPAKDTGPSIDDLFKDTPDQKEKPTGKEYGVGETALMHGAHGATMGFSDELKGAMRAAPFLKDAPGYALTVPRLIAGLTHLGYEKLGNYIAGDNQHEASDDYKKGRDEYRSELDESSRQNPATAIGSDIAGSMLVPVPGGAATGAGARFVKGALTGAGMGIARGAGEANEISNIPHDATWGGIFGAGLGGIFGSIFGPRVTPQNLAEAKKLAEQYGVQLPNYMVSDSVAAQSAGKTLDKLPFMGGKLKAANETAHEGVAGIGQKEITALTGKYDPSTSELGQAASGTIRKAIDDWTVGAKNVVNDYYDDVGRAMTNPGARVPLHNTSSVVAQLALRASEAGQKPDPMLKSMIRATSKIGGMTFEGLKDARTALSKNHEVLKRKGGVDYAAYAALRDAITKDMENAVLIAGGPAANALWQKANTAHGIRKDISAQLLDAAGKSDDSFSKVMGKAGAKSGSENLSSLNAVKASMKPAEWQQVQAAAISKLGYDEAGVFSPAKFLTNYNKKLSEGGKNILFGPKGSATRDALDAQAKLSKVIQDSDKLRNFSNTATIGAGIAAATGLISDIAKGDYAQAAKKTIGEIGGGMLLGTILARPATARNYSTFATQLEKYLTRPAMAGIKKYLTRPAMAGIKKYLTRPAMAGIKETPRALETAARNLAISIAKDSDVDPDVLIKTLIGQ